MHTTAVEEPAGLGDADLEPQPTHTAGGHHSDAGSVFDLQELLIWMFLSRNL